MNFIAKKLLSFYKKYISAALPSTCIYTPTCSSYTYQAVSKYGAILGSFMGFWRILRCNPLAKGGFDPVRENYKGKAKWLI
ncbi:MAG: membrane protein insertion efficiency factor YidD [Clostridia bacterium]|nr:membrane protein insertion efficiency factor YidD [Clostridia bacterium]